MNILVVLYSFLFSFSITGKVKDANTGEPLQGVKVELVETGMSSITDSSGKYYFHEVAAEHYTLRIQHMGYKSVLVNAAGPHPADILLQEETAVLEQVPITSIRGKETDPVSQKVLKKKDIEKQYFGQEIPFILSRTPSVVSYSDGGNYTGYSYFRLRGIDQTRINFTLNGVPLNDAEDQGVYFSNFAGFAGNIQSVQVQRGVGTSTFGTASYGGSVNFESVNLYDTAASAELQQSYGSFHSYQTSASYRTGLLKKKFSFYGRYTLAGTDGYRYHSGNKSNTFFFSGAYFGRSSMLKLTAFAGRIKNDLAYVPVAASDIARDPRTNYLSPSERDDFAEDFVQLLYTKDLKKHLHFTASAYYTRVAGGYDVLIAPGLYNFAVKSGFAGAYVNAQYEKDRLKLTVGANGSAFRREHTMSQRPFVDTLFYRNNGYKNEASLFTKLSWTANRLELYADLQGRFAQFIYHPDKAYNIALPSVSWAFFNPRAGVSYSITQKLSAYASLGRTGREPTRNDMLAGFDDIDTSNIGLVGDLKRVKPEYVTDFEAGLKARAEKLSMQVNFFNMNFRNEIAAIGKLSYIGLPLRKNVAKSYRRGVELDIRWRPVKALTASQMLTLSRNRISSYTSDADTVSVTYHNITPLLTPSLISTSSLEYRFTKWLEAELSCVYMSKAYLDNTNNEHLVTPSFFLLNARLRFNINANTSLSAFVNNITDTRYYTSGYAVAGQPYYYVQAPRNYFLNLQVKF